MPKCASDFTKNGQANEPALSRRQPDEKLTLATFAPLCEEWVLDAEIADRSPRTVEERRGLVDKLLWFLRHREFEGCGRAELRAFLAYIPKAHESPEGRWGDRTNSKNCRPVGTVTLAAYHRNLTTLFHWLVKEGELSVSPMDRIERPRVQADQPHPFTTEQVQALLTTARASREPHRNQAIVYFLLDTGARISELCDLRMQDVDFTARRCRVEGKGRKARTLPLGRTATKALWTYHNEACRDTETDFFFVAGEGSLEGVRITERGVRELIQRLGESANVKGVRCSPHTFRHTFAISFLRNGGNIYALQEILGHTSLAMVRRYLQLAEADIIDQHRQFSPADRLGREKRQNGR